MLLNFLWGSFHYIYISNHYAVHRKHTMFYVNYVFIKLEKMDLLPVSEVFHQDTERIKL